MDSPWSRTSVKRVNLLYVSWSDTQAACVRAGIFKTASARVFLARALEAAPQGDTPQTDSSPIPTAGPPEEPAAGDTHVP